MKKLIKIVLIILILSFIAITINNIYVMNIWGLDKSNSISEEEIIELVEKGTTNGNYIYTKAFDSEYDVNASVDIYVKDNIVAAYYAGKPYYWIDYNNEVISFKNFFSPIVSIMRKGNHEHLYVNGDHKPILSSGDIFSKWSKSKYLGETQINGRDTVVIETIHRADDYGGIKILSKISNFFTKYFYFIDKETGILVREQIAQGPRLHKGSIIIEKWVEDYNIKFNCVTDEDVKRPDLEGYTIQYEDIYDLY